MEFMITVKKGSWYKRLLIVAGAIYKRSLRKNDTKVE